MAILSKVCSLPTQIPKIMQTYEISQRCMFVKRIGRCQSQWQVVICTICFLSITLHWCTDALRHPRIFKDKLQVQICSNVWTWCWFILEFIHVCLRQIDGTSSLLIISAQCYLSVTATGNGKTEIAIVALDKKSPMINHCLVIVMH